MCLRGKSSSSCLSGTGHSEQVFNVREGWSGGSLSFCQKLASAFMICDLEQGQSCQPLCVGVGVGVLGEGGLGVGGWVGEKHKRFFKVISR